MKRREYTVDLTVNDIKITKVIVDPHYEEKHSASIDDELILNLVKFLDGNLFEADAVKEPYSYYVTEEISLDERRYKLVWLLEDDQIYIGVINAYRS
ncbi:hypothetical protein A9Q84_14695 [Halobacteriovorax marinus]|uniref:DUF4258 domain-containing protein n=1 Tax=Halobacteriovorax marinus TaxID=97084 RepID=A0A1Y5F507_9BACT|nr:hypothetical protein A9Q84_14695 [Halobacteriovorax marinus]